MSQKSDQAILDSLEHLIFDEHKIMSHRWVGNYFKIRSEKSKQILSEFVNKHEDKLFVQYCILGMKKPMAKYHAFESKTSENDEDDDVDMNDHPNNKEMDKNPIFTITIVRDSKLNEIKKSYEQISNIYIHSIAIKQCKEIKDFQTALLREDLDQQSKINMERSKNNKNNAPKLPRAIAPTKVKNVQKPKPLSFEKKVEKLTKNHQKKQKPGPTPLSNKLQKLTFQKSDSNASNDSNANNNNNKTKNDKEEAKKSEKEKGGIAASFAKATNSKTSSPKSQTAKSVEPKNAKKNGRRKSDEITNFFEKETEQTKSTEKSKKGSKKSTKKSTKKKKKTTAKKKKKTKKKKKDKIPIKAARKRKRGEMEEAHESGLAPIDYDSESSEPSHLDNLCDEDDDELEAMIAMKPSAKRRKIADSDDENDYVSDHQNDANDVNGDQDVDLNDGDEESEKKEKKMSKKELKRIQKEKLLEERKKNFFGAAKGNKGRKRKKKKTIQKSYIDSSGMFVTEDVEVTDNDNDDDEKHVVEPQKQLPMSEDEEDVDMKDNKENSVDNGNKKKQKKGAKDNSKKAAKKSKKNASITSFFRKQ